MLHFIRFIFLISVSLFITNISAIAANPLGFEIGKANYDDVQARLSSVIHLKNQGINKYSGGKMIIADKPELLGYDGLQKVTMIFDNKNILTAVVMRLIRSDNGKRDAGFMYAYERLSEKYLPVFKNLQTTGRMTAGFTTPSKDVHIRMMATRSSNEFDLQYLSDEFWQRYESNQISTEERKSAQYEGATKESLF
jgi:hypothetical protein